LNGCADQGHFLHRLEIPERELKPKSKKQKGNPDLCKLLNFVDTRNRETARVGAQDHSSQDVAQNQWLPQSLQQ